MARLDDDMLSLHLEVTLSGAAPALLSGLADPDRRQRHAAIGGLGRHIVERLRCFDIQSEETGSKPDQPGLFPDDLGPIA